ncbi:25S rRNA (adenine2142-N1)-methyltransferase [Ophidiomyces ophidiicola]|nr:25S rRNA (adenine2142-N1)-methyltransferase [Ophidiomyces ophidiicola]KAI1926452.1 25S rRNA (adenine2142-N1)-methyltransferase [Ophidiomyces ophidiicola]KAI1931651.1 25S rRNA (adenine2142-N1)-methyltransferase [Ophidiomyces ophidiicola]KAI1986038.1 25S rRNA (adenine2142-N1)-methyltransferase [Ophidiomyces ophidiicola]KAI2013813.1 25S rRNA (adenine2142-N1)-methyltransferase [Ophidiomyces ophidiicola]
MGKASRKTRPKSLRHGRPPTAHQPTVSLSAKATRTLIRSHHQLQKARTQALKDGNEELVCELDKRIAATGGLESYQLASKKGQSKERGGDSSKTLIEWLQPALKDTNDGFQFRLLEIGALSTKNACSNVPSISVTRIDLHSQEPGISQQDFMDRPLPASDNDKFHIISLSLVLNYVPDPVARGDMLRRTVKFLVPTSLASKAPTNDLMPCLFLVLPAPCVLNSRYFTENRLHDIMTSLGYSMMRRKLTQKLIYQLWVHQPLPDPAPSEFRKEILNPGPVRNNFSVILKSRTSSETD